MVLVGEVKLINIRYYILLMLSYSRRSISKSPFGIVFVTVFHQILNFFFAKIECGLYFLDRFDVLMSKIIFKKWKNIISMYFSTKSYLKSTRNHTAKHAPSRLFQAWFGNFVHKYKGRWRQILVSLSNHNLYTLAVLTIYIVCVYIQYK